MPGAERPLDKYQPLLFLLLELGGGTKSWARSHFSGQGVLPSLPLEGTSPHCSGRHVQECDGHLFAPGGAPPGKEVWSFAHPVFAPDCKCSCPPSSAARMAWGSWDLAWSWLQSCASASSFRKPSLTAAWVWAPPLPLLLI